MTALADLRVAVVGCGVISANHARAMMKVPGLVIVATVDKELERASALAELIETELGAQRPRIAADLAEVAPYADIALICTPSGTHVGLTEQAVTVGLHVVLEKPLDVLMSRGRRLVQIADAAAQRGLSVTVISQHRFDPASVVVADAVRDGRFGRLTSAVASVAWWRSQEYYDSGSWRGTWELDGGGALMNQGVHTVDLLVWLLGRPVEVFAYTGLLAHERVAVEDVAVATVAFESGALAVLHATTAAYPGLSARLQVYGSRGSAIIDDDQLATFLADGDAQDRTTSAVPEGERAGDVKSVDAFAEGHARQYRDIVESIRAGRPPSVAATDALRALAVVRGIYVSATLGRPVAIADLIDGTVDDTDVRTGVLPDRE